MSSFFSKLASFFKKLFDLIKKILTILLIIIAVMLLVWACIASGGAVLTVFGFAISQTMAIVLGCLAITGAFLLDPTTAKKVVGKIGEAAGEAAAAVGGAVGNVIGGAASGISSALFGSNGIWLIAAVVGGYFLLSSSSDEESSRSTSPALRKGDKSRDELPARVANPSTNELSNGLILEA